VYFLSKCLLYLHILSAIVSMGPFFALIPLVNQLRSPNASEQIAYFRMFRIAIQLGKHAGHVLVVTGILLVITGGWSWRTSWIVLTILILVSSLYFLVRAFSLKLRKLEEPGVERGSIVRELRRSIWMYLILLLAMLWLMVTKPELW
jgi:uncharacterized membrane protein